MVVFGSIFCLVVVVVLIKMEHIHQAQVLELLQSTVNGRKADTRFFFPCPAVYFVGVQVMSSPAYNVQDNSTL